MRNGSEKCPITSEFVQGVRGTVKKQQPNNHVPNQKKTRKVVV